MIQKKTLIRAEKYCGCERQNNPERIRLLICGGFLYKSQHEAGKQTNADAHQSVFSNSRLLNVVRNYFMAVWETTRKVVFTTQQSFRLCSQTGALKLVFLIVSCRLKKPRSVFERTCFVSVFGSVSCLAVLFQIRGPLT